MKRLIFAIVLILFVLCGCENSKVCEEGEFWRITENSSGSNTTYDYIIYNDARDILIEGESKTKPEITIDDSSRICIFIGNGSEYTVQYVLPDSNSASEVFENPLAWKDGIVAIIDENDSGDATISVYSSLGEWEWRNYELPIAADMLSEDAILSAAFDEYINNLTVIYVSQENEPCAAVLPINLLDWENNPIDRFYDKYTVEAYGTREEISAMRCEKEIWKAEFENAYQMLRGMANPKIDYLQTDINNSEKAFEEYVKAYARFYMTYDWSDAFSYYGEVWADDVFYGSGAPSAALYCEAEMYRQATLDLYRMMNDRFESVDEAFIFDEVEYLNFLRTEANLTVVVTQED